MILWALTIVISRGSFPFEDKLRNYVSDEADFKSILEWRNNTEGPFFMFNVTMQNHSNYGGDFDNFDPQIVAKFKNTYSNKYLNKYLSLMYETDQDVASLLSELSQSDRKTIVVFWGDHQPNDYVVRPIYKEYGLDFDNQTYESTAAAVRRRHFSSGQIMIFRSRQM